MGGGNPTQGSLVAPHGGVPGNGEVTNLDSGRGEHMRLPCNQPDVGSQLSLMPTGTNVSQRSCRKRSQAAHLSAQQPAEKTSVNYRPIAHDGIDSKVTKTSFNCRVSSKFRRAGSISLDSHRAGRSGWATGNRSLCSAQVPVASARAA